MKHRSSYDQMPPELVHREQELADTASAVDQLARSLLPAARSVLQSAMRAQTAAAAAGVLRAQAEHLLRSVLDDRTLEEMAGSTAAAEREARSWFAPLEPSMAAALAATIDERAEQEWLDLLSRDLARALAGHHLAWRQVERSAMAPEQTEARKTDVQALVGRFGVPVGDIERLLGELRFAALSPQFDPQPAWVQPARPA